MNDTPDPEGAERRRQENFSSVEISRSVEAVLESGVVRTGPGYHPVFDEFESQHVTQFLENMHTEDVDERNFRRDGRRIVFSLVFLVIFVFIFLTIFLLPSHRDIYFEIVKIAFTFLGGMGVGYGIQTYREQREAE